MKKIVAAVVLIAVLLGNNLPVHGARILAVLPLIGRSHHRFFQPLLKTLAKAGHEVVVYSPFSLEKLTPNYTDILLDVSKLNDKVNEAISTFVDRPHRECLDPFITLMELNFDIFINSDKIQKLLLSKEKFDLVFTEAFTSQEFSVILGHIFKAPVIALQAFFTNSLVNSHVGNSLSLASIPDTCSSFSNKMTLLERLLNSFYVLRNLYFIHFNRYLTLVETRLKDNFPDSPPLLDMINNVSLVFINDHLTADYAQPRTPNIIPVAGIHIKEEKPLPQAIQSFMDKASEGVILFSLGTYVPDELQPKEYFDMYIRVFRQLKQRVLWKTRKQNIQGVPDNVMILEWAPQQDILAHPKCVVFITHGGMLSQHEAIHYGVPVVAIPQFFDQHRNARFYKERGIGVQLDKEDLSENTVLAAIRTVVNNPQYMSNMKDLSRVFRDRPMTPAETVVFWTEYVLRHGGSHLRPASTQLSWYQLALLDVLAVILAMLTSGTLIIYFICRRIYTYLCGNRNINQARGKKRC